MNLISYSVLSTPPPTPIAPFKKSLMHSWNLSFCSLNFIPEVNTQLAFPLLRVFKTGIWLLGNDNGLKFVQTTSFFCEIDSTELNMSNQIITRSPSVNLIPLRQQVIENWAEWCNTDPRQCYENSIDDFNETHYLFITRSNLRVIFTDGILS